jgi:predicted nucleic acid-binding protein
MTFLLDTNVVSELAKPNMSHSVELFLRRTAEERLFISVVTLAEIRYGLALLPAGQRRERMEQWLDFKLIARFKSRTLNIEPEIALAWGDLMAGSRRSGANLQPMEGLLAATARVSGLTLATRNVKHFADLGVPVFNPWDDA